MAVSSRKEIRDHSLKLVGMDETDSTNQALTNDFINDTIMEINDPGWAYAPKQAVNYTWSFLRRSKEFDTVANQQDYVLAREIDIVDKIKFDNDHPLVPINVEDWTRIYDRTTTGKPFLYFQWGASGVATKLGTADKIDVVSSSASDSGDTDLNVTVWGYVSGILTSETYQLNGASTVSGSTTFDANDIFISKSKSTSGTITCTENSGSTTVLVLGAEERNPTFKVISLYNVPDAVKNGDIYFHTRLRQLTNDSDTPQFDSKWHHVVVKGVVAKLYQHMGDAKANSFLIATEAYKSATRAMVEADRTEPDLIPRLRRHPRLHDFFRLIVRRSQDAVS